MQVVLVMFRPDGSRRSFSLARDLTVIGRGEDCDLRIPLGEVSRKHARLAKDGDTLHLEDLGSSNGTFVNGLRIQEATLQGGDILHVGPLSFILQLDGVPADEEIVPPEQQLAASSDDTGTAPAEGGPVADDAIQADDQGVVELEEAVEDVPLEAVEEAPPTPPTPPAPPRRAGRTPPPLPPMPPAPPLPPGVEQFEPTPLEEESPAEPGEPAEEVLEADQLEIVDDLAQQVTESDDIQIIDDTPDEPEGHRRR